MFLKFGEEVEGVDGLELVEVGIAEFFEDRTVERSKKQILMAVALGSFCGARR